MAAADKTGPAMSATPADALAAIEHSPTLKRVRDTATITIGVREASVPFSFIDNQKQPQGYSVDLCLKVADAIKNELKLPRLDVRFVAVTSSNRIAMVKDGKVDLESFFAQAPQINPNVGLITGVVCGVRVEEVADPLMQKIRYLDKLIDELAKGKKMASILRR